MPLVCALEGVASVSEKVKSATAPNLQQKLPNLIRKLYSAPVVLTKGQPSTRQKPN